jgi:hypothetical protein
VVVVVVVAAAVVVVVVATVVVRIRFFIRIFFPPIFWGGRLSNLNGNANGSTCRAS